MTESLTMMATSLPYVGTEPTRGSDQAAGLDLRAADTVTIPSGAIVPIPTGTRVALPTGTVGLLAGRSSLTAKHGLALANGIGVIDADYRGEIIGLIRNDGRSSRTIVAGERIMQLLIMPVARALPVEVDTLTPTARGEGGFGSTGEA